MAYHKILFVLTYLILVDTLVIKTNEIDIKEEESDRTNASNKENDPINTFNGVYTECLLGMSFICLQKKTLIYLNELNRLNEVSVFGDYLKFVRLNTSENTHEEESMSGENSDELSIRIDRAVDKFFDNHLIRFSALGKDLLVPRKVEEFVGRKRRKGGGGGGHGGGDGGKKKMMMMAMMCMKMKFMMMIPAMMGMMGMMSFKGMMFSMMSFLIAKMMLLMKILEKKGGGGGGGGGGSWAGDGGWAAGGGGGAWMPAGQDYGGGYDANGQWQSRSIIEEAKDVQYNKGPIISYVKPTVRYNNNKNNDVKKVNDEIVKIDHEPSLKSRKKRGLIDVLQNAYMYWTKVLGPGRKKHFYPKYKVINGMKYVYSPIRNVPKMKTPKELRPVIKNTEDTSQIITIDNYNKGEIIEAVEGRMNRRKFYKIKDNVNETMDDNPWE